MIWTDDWWGKRTALEVPWCGATVRYLPVFGGITSDSNRSTQMEPLNGKFSPAPDP